MMAVYYEEGVEDSPPIAIPPLSRPDKWIELKFPRGEHAHAIDWTLTDGMERWMHFSPPDDEDDDDDDDLARKRKPTGGEESLVVEDLDIQTNNNWFVSRKGNYEEYWMHPKP